MKVEASKRKALYLAMSILVACCIWFYVDVSSAENPTQDYRDIPIVYLNEDTVLADRGFMLVEEGTDTTIDLTLEGPRLMLCQISRDDILVTADLSDITSAGVQTVKYTISITGRTLSGDRITLGNFTVRERSIENATVNIQELNSKDIPVKCEIVGSVAEGYSAGELQLSRELIEIRGQAADIDPVAYAKVVLNLDDAVSTVTEELTVQYYDENDQPVDSSGIHATTGETVQVTLPVTVVKELRLTLNFIESAGASRDNISYKISPETITVSGDAAILNEMERIVLDDFDLSSLTGTAASSHTYPITVPEGCENLSGVTRATLTIAFKDMTEEQRTTTSFTYENLPEGKSCHILTEELTVRIFGTAADVAAVSDGDIRVVADLSGFGAANGSYTVPARVEVLSGEDVGIAGTYQVRVTIGEPQDLPEEDPGGSDETQ